jgi:hypothetical protein
VPRTGVLGNDTNDTDTPLADDTETVDTPRAEAGDPRAETRDDTDTPLADDHQHTETVHTPRAEAGDPRAETRAKVATDNTPPPRRVGARLREQKTAATTDLPPDPPLDEKAMMARENCLLAASLAAELPGVAMVDLLFHAKSDEETQEIAQRVGMGMRDALKSEDRDSILNQKPFAGFSQYAITLKPHNSDVQSRFTRRLSGRQQLEKLDDKFEGLSKVVDSATTYANQQTGNRRAFNPEFLVESHILYQCEESLAGASFGPHQDDDTLGSHNSDHKTPGYTLIIALYVKSGTPRTGVRVFGEKENEAAEYETNGDFVFFPSMMWHESTTQPPTTESGESGDYEVVKLALFFSAPRRMPRE